jgi:hypothetical protein
MNDVPRRPPTIAQLELFFENKKPFNATHLGDLFSALAYDYGKLTNGRKLIIADIRTGTLLAILQDAWAIGGDIITVASPYAKNVASIATGGKALLDFSKTLRQVFERTKKDPNSIAPARTKRVIGAKTVRVLAKVAHETQSEVKITTRTADGDIIEVCLTPLEALQIKEGVEATPLPRSSTRLLESNVSEEPLRAMLSDVATRLSAVNAGSDSELTALASALAETLGVAGMTSMADELAQRLEMRGHAQVAELLRAEISRGGKRTLPSVE